MMDALPLTALLASAVALAVPLALAALGEAVTERAGVINIGLEGSVIWGALAGALGSLALGPYAGLASGTLAGGAVALLFAAFAVRLNTDQIITGTAVTIGSLGFTGAVFQSRFGATGVALDLGTAPTLAVPLLSRLPVLGPAFFEQAIPAYVAYCMVPVLAWFLFRTRWGLELRAAGEAPDAAHAAGVPVVHVRMMATLFGGLMAGLAGAHLSLVYTGTFAENMSAGRGFIAIAVVVLGRWRPAWIFASALFFGAAQALQFALQAISIDLPYPVFLGLPYVLCLAALAGWFGRSQAPGALGQPWPRH